MEKKRKKSSQVWTFFREIDNAYAQCSQCKQKFSYKSSTTNLSKHLLKKHHIKIEADFWRKNGRPDLDQNCNENDDEDEQAQDIQEEVNNCIKYIIPDNISNHQPAPKYPTIHQLPKPILQPTLVKRDTDSAKNRRAITNDENPFDIFGKSITAQLKMLPRKQAFNTQLKIQNILTEQLLHYEDSLSDNVNNDCT